MANHNCTTNLGDKKSVRLWKDLYAISDGSWKKAIVTIITNPCFHSVCLFRLSSLLYRLRLTLLAKLIWYLNRVIYCVDIDYRADLAGGLVLVHGLGVVIGCGVVSKGKLVVYQHVTLGGNRGRKSVINNQEMQQPYIEEDVRIFTGASVFGPVHIKKGTVIKAGSIITDLNEV